jgi:hypothetical protein
LLGLGQPGQPHAAAEALDHRLGEGTASPISIESHEQFFDLRFNPRS